MHGTKFKRYKRMCKNLSQLTFLFQRQHRVPVFQASFLRPSIHVCVQFCYVLLVSCPISETQYNTHNPKEEMFNLGHAVLVSYTIITHNTDTHNLKEKRFNLGHGFGGFSPWLADSKEGTSWQKDVVERNTSFVKARKQSTETVPQWKGPGTSYRPHDPP